MEIACLDLEGVLVPENWIAFAEKTGIDALRATTRDIPDYDVLMKQRLSILAEHGLTLPDIQEVIDLTVAIGSRVNQAIRPVGISVNTSSLSDEERNAYLSDLSERYGLPAVDPLQGGVGPIVEHLGELYS